MYEIFAYSPQVECVRLRFGAAAPVLDWLESKFAGSRMNVALADGGGVVLQRRFGERSPITKNR